MRKLIPILLIGLLLHEEIQAQCNPAFNTSINGATIQLYATDSSFNLAHSWKFGDGTYGWGAQVAHTYNSPGTYVVKHYVVDSLNNCRDSAQQTITISFTVSCSASFITVQDSTHANNYHFYSNSTVGGGSIQSYNWTVNGSTVSFASAFSSSLSPGVNFVCLTIQTTAGCTSSVCDSIWADTVNCNLSASFIATADSLNPAKITFTPSPLAPGLSYAWNFGDGHVSFTSSPIHIYNNPGTYNVTLTIADSAAGCSDSAHLYIVIPQRDSCTASFTYMVNPSQPNQYTFTAVSSDTAVISYHWMIQPCDSTSTDSVTYNTANPVHTFTSPGCYRVCLHLITLNGCRKSFCDTVIVNYSLAASFVTSFPNPVQGGQVQLRLDLVQSEKVKITVFNSFGHSVYTNEKAYGTGQSRISIPVDKLQRGLYYIDIQYGNNRKRSVFQKL